MVVQEMDGSQSLTELYIELLEVSKWRQLFPKLICAVVKF